jgi:hypothetical protein
VGDVPVAQSAEALPSEGRRWGFESSSGHHPKSGLAQTRLFGDSTSPASTGFLRSAAVAQLAEAAGLNPVQCRIVACLRHQLPALPDCGGCRQWRLAQRKSVGPTNRRSRYRNSQRLPNTNKPSRSSKAEQPADRGSLPCGRTKQGDRHERPAQTRGLMDPERSADWIGSRLLIYPQEDRNLRGSRTPSLMGRAAGS